jgi:hypothetical protein
MITEDKARTRLKLMYGMTHIRQDPNGTWWIGSDLRPDLLNMDSLAAAAQYLDSLPESMIDNLTRPRGSDSEQQHTQHSQQEPEHG